MTKQLIVRVSPNKTQYNHNNIMLDHSKLMVQFNEIKVLCFYQKLI